MVIQSLSLRPAEVTPGDPMVITVGVSAVEGGFAVEKITYHPAQDLYNKGKEVGRPGYAVSFVGIPERRFIYEDAVCSLQITKEPKASTTVPELPE